jgi:hypothetical protein
VEDAPPGDGLQVPLEIADVGGGGTLALVPVSVHGQGPFAFGLDTGASHSVIDAGLAEELGLDGTGASGEMRGVFAAQQVTLVEVERWQLGGVDLEPRPLAAIDLHGGDGGDAIGALQGLLGSDMLSEFGTVVIDYDAGTLTLRPRSG